MALYDSPSESFLEFFLYSPCRFLKSFPSTLSLRKEEIVLDLGLCTGRPDDKLLSGFEAEYHDIGLRESRILSKKILG